jgi:hypothetical protein
VSILSTPLRGERKRADRFFSRAVIYLQLWALGRAADPNNLKKEANADVVSASDIPFEGGAKPRPLSKEEIQVSGRHVPRRL